jgi:uncharacterized membrane protein
MHTTAYRPESKQGSEQAFEHASEPSVDQLQRWGALTAATIMIGYGISRRSVRGLLLAAGAAPLAYRGATGRWPAGLESLVGATGDTRAALSGPRGINVRESVRLECPIDEVYRFWSRLENLPTFMENLAAVTDLGGGRSHWVARGPGGVRVEWDAEIINEIQNKVLAWKSLPGGDVVSAGSVAFEPARGNDSGTQLTVTLQYQPPAGKFGKLVASAFGSEPSQTIREDLRRLKQLLEAGEIAKAAGSAGTSAGAGR